MSNVLVERGTEEAEQRPSSIINFDAVVTKKAQNVALRRQVKCSVGQCIKGVGGIGKFEIFVPGAGTPTWNLPMCEGHLERFTVAWKPVVDHDPNL